jgi:hypothetical protein
MLLTLYSAKEHAGTLSDLAKHLGLQPFEVGCPEIIGKLAKDIQEELDRYYMPCPFDSNHNVINVGDELDVGNVVGVGEGYVYVSDEPEGQVTGYLVNETTHVQPGTKLIKQLAKAVNDGVLSEYQKRLISDYIAGCYDVG